MMPPALATLNDPYGTGPRSGTNVVAGSQSYALNRDPDGNVVGGSLLACSTDPTTGFYRDGGQGIEVACVWS